MRRNHRWHGICDTDGQHFARIGASTAGRVLFRSASDTWKEDNVANKNRHNAAFVVGAVLGGLGGAAAALWKTPYTGEELRMKLTGGGRTSHSSDVETRAVSATPAQERSFKDKVLSTVESTLAPVVGVKLGKTANEGGSVTAGTSRVSTGQNLEPTTSMGPGAGARPSTETVPASGSFRGNATGEPPARPSDDEVGYRNDRDAGGNANVTPVDEDAEVPSRMSSPTEPVPEDAAASVEDLTKPQINLVPDAFQEQKGEMRPFPKLGGTEPSR
jgi:gas vesicle protein